MKTMVYALKLILIFMFSGNSVAGEWATASGPAAGELVVASGQKSIDVYDAKGTRVGIYALVGANYPSVFLKAKSGWIDTKVSIDTSNASNINATRLYWVPSFAHFKSSDCSGEPIPIRTGSEGMLPSAVIITSDGKKILYVGKSSGGSLRTSYSQINSFNDFFEPICSVSEAPVFGWDIDFSINLNSIFTPRYQVLT